MSFTRDGSEYMNKKQRQGDGILQHSIAEFMYSVTATLTYTISQDERVRVHRLKKLTISIGSMKEFRIVTVKLSQSYLLISEL